MLQSIDCEGKHLPAEATLLPSANPDNIIEVACS